MRIYYDYDSALLAHNTTTLFTIFSALRAPTLYTVVAVNLAAGGAMGYVCMYIHLLVGLCVKKEELLSINFDERN